MGRGRWLRAVACLADSGTSDLRPFSELETPPRPHYPQAERPPWAVRGRPVVESPLDTATVARLIGGAHGAAVRADSDQKEPEADQRCQQGETHEGARAQGQAVPSTSLVHSTHESTRKSGWGGASSGARSSRT